jgi:hypothetical protein
MDDDNGREGVRQWHDTYHPVQCSVHRRANSAESTTHVLNCTFLVGRLVRDGISACVRR